MGYLWSYSLGLQRELVPNVGLTVDYVGNRGRNQSTQIDISEGPVGPDGRITRLTPAQFDPDGTIIPPVARDVDFGRVLQYQTLDALNSDYDSLEFGLEKRFSNRWSGRVAYTVAKSHDVAPQTSALDGRVSNDLDPRMDYGRSSTDNRHAFVTSVNVTPFGGLGVGAIFRYYSGFPINETTGTDNNGDRDDNDRPVRGVNDAARPIVSELDANGRAVRNGIDGESTKVLDLQVQYIVNLPRVPDGGLLLGDVQRVELDQLRERDRRAQQLEVPGAGRGGTDAVDAARCAVYVLAGSRSRQGPARAGPRHLIRSEGPASARPFVLTPFRRRRSSAASAHCRRGSLPSARCPGTTRSAPGRS